MPKFAGQVALVTGATTGIGRASALAFAREGADVVLAARRVESGKNLAAEIQELGVRSLFVQTDVSQEDQVSRLMAATADKFGRLDIAFNNAGTEGAHFLPTHEQTVENYQTVMDCNVLGVLLCMKHELPLMLAAGRGVMVNCSSVLGTLGSAGMGIYSASKHAVIGLTRSAALEYAQQGIRINAVCPGGVETEMAQRLTEQSGNAEAFAAFHPMGRVAKPEEIASAVLFLCSTESAFATGSALIIDGGWSAR